MNHVRSFSIHRPPGANELLTVFIIMESWMNTQIDEYNKISIKA